MCTASLCRESRSTIRTIDQLQDVGADKDAITSLRAPTHFGRPNVSRTNDMRQVTDADSIERHRSGIESLKALRASIRTRTVAFCELQNGNEFGGLGLTRINLFPNSFCGPPVLSKQLHLMSNKHTTPEGCRFFYGKENF
jgi:hypothetical protein